jgi:hypothetical protein
MSPSRPSFPPDVARALQRSEGKVSVRYTLPSALIGPPAVHTVLMETPYEAVLAALTLDTDLNLRFTRTGSRTEGARTALVNVSQLVGGGRHWDIELTWSADELTVAVRDQRDPGGRVFSGRSPRLTP